MIEGLAFHYVVHEGHILLVWQGIIIIYILNYLIHLNRYRVTTRKQHQSVVERGDSLEPLKLTHTSHSNVFVFVLKTTEFNWKDSPKFN